MPAPNPVRELIKREGLLRIPGASIHERYELFEPFEKRPGLQAALDPSTVNQAALRLYTVMNKSFVVEGTNAAVAALNVDGGCLLTTAGSDNDQCIVRPAEAVNSVALSAWNTVEWEPEHEIRFETVVEAASIAAIQIMAGWALDPANLDLTTDDDKAVLLFNPENATSAANWVAATSIGGTDAAMDTTIAAEAAKSVRLGITVSSTRVPRFYVNGTLVHTGGALTAGANFLPFVGVQALTGSAKTLALRYIRCSRVLTAA